MAIIKQKGAPNRNTKGSIGDIYIDTKTGNAYKCTFAYMVNGQCDCSWALDEGMKVDVVEPKPAGNVAKVEPVIEKTVVEEPVQEVKNDVVAEKPAHQPRRTDYASYGKKK